MTVVQEFYCNDCDGYFRARLSLGFNRSIYMVCPACDRHHPRVVHEGMIYESGRMGKEWRKHEAQEIHVPKSSYSKIPVTRAMAKAQSILAQPYPDPTDRKAVAAFRFAYEQTRNSAKVEESRQIIQESWNDRHTDKYEPEQ